MDLTFTSFCLLFEYLDILTHLVKKNDFSIVIHKKIGPLFQVLFMSSASL